MAEQYDPFLPQRVDESIERLTATDQAAAAFREQMRTDQDARLILDLQQLYGPERVRYQQALQRVEHRLVERYSSQQGSGDFSTAPLQQQHLWGRWRIQQRSGKRHKNTMEIKQSSTSFVTRLATRLSLVAVILVILGSMVALANYVYVHQSTTAATGGSTTMLPGEQIKQTPTPTPGIPIGTTLYTTPSNTWGFENFSWSPDSKRIASVTIDSAQIWDANNGKHLVTVQMPGGASEAPKSLAWSPIGQEVAISTTQHVLIVNAQTGQIIRSYAGATANTRLTASATGYLSRRLPMGDGSGYVSTTWSPDGRLMASARSFGPSGDVQVWNPNTGALNLTLNVGNPSYVITNVSWSSDGQYLAANTFNTQGGTDPTKPTNRVIVWSMATHKLVFQHDDRMNGDAPVIWQPHSHNLAFTGSAISNGRYFTALKIWNITTNQQVKQYVGKGNGALAWSPDGKYLAYGGYVTSQPPMFAVFIIDPVTDKQVYAYKGHHHLISTLVWSPNGKYIVSGEGNTTGDMVGKVWAAQ